MPQLLLREEGLPKAPSGSAMVQLPPLSMGGWMAEHPHQGSQGLWAAGPEGSTCRPCHPPYPVTQPPQLVWTLCAG